MIPRHLVIVASSAAILGLVASMTLSHKPKSPGPDSSNSIPAGIRPNTERQRPTTRDSRSYLRDDARWSGATGFSAGLKASSPAETSAQEVMEIDLAGIQPAEVAPDQPDTVQQIATWVFELAGPDGATTEGECTPHGGASLHEDGVETSSPLATVLFEQKLAPGADALRIRTTLVDAAKSGAFGDALLSGRERDELLSSVLDLNSDGLVDLADLTTLLLTQGMRTSSALDLDGDGVCGGTDVAEWLNLFTRR